MVVSSFLLKQELFIKVYFSGAVSKWAIPSLEQKEVGRALVSIRFSLDTSFGDRTIMYE